MVSTNSSGSSTIQDTFTLSESNKVPSNKKMSIKGFRKLVFGRRVSQTKPSSSLNAYGKLDPANVGSSGTLVTCNVEEDDSTSRQSELDLDNDMQYSASSFNTQDHAEPQDTLEEEVVAALFLKGRAHSLNKRWDEAIDCHEQALRVCNKYMKARIEYELAKIELAKLEKRSGVFYTHTKSKVHQCAVNYYEVELLRKRQSKSQDSSRDILSILHTLGRLYDEKLNDFDNALRCYNEALAMESLLYNDDQEQTIQKTRKKIGRIHHKMGNFELAMITSFVM